MIQSVATWTKEKPEDRGLIWGHKIVLMDGRVFVHEYEDYGRIPILPVDRYSINGKPVTADRYYSEANVPMPRIRRREP